MQFHKIIFILFCTSSIAALALAYIMEYGFDVLPCQICTYQRIMYFCAIFFSLSSLLFYKRFFLLLTVVSYCMNAGIAFYQIAIEHGWITNILSCSSPVELKNMSDSEILEYTMTHNIVSCDVPALIIFGISIAGWNMIYCMLVLAAYLYCKKRYEFPVVQKATDTTSNTS